MREYFLSQFTSAEGKKRGVLHAALRDTLLPKLISGELKAKDEEAFLKDRGL